VTGVEAYNTSRLNLRAILADPGQVARSLRALVGTLDVGGGREDQGGSVLIPQQRLPRTGGIDDSAVVAR
jgi:hypothetical protein